MPLNRRQFIRRSFGLVTVSAIVPNIWMRTAEGRDSGSGVKRLVVIQQAGGNDGLNTVIPYTDSRYYSLRPGISFKESELKDASGASTVISDRFGLHPSLGHLKGLYAGGKVAIVLGVGYPRPDLSHFTSMAIWQSADPLNATRFGWLGRYADQAFAGTGTRAVSFGDFLPASLKAGRVIIPNIPDFSVYGFERDPKYPSNLNNQVEAFKKLHTRGFPSDSLIAAEAATGLSAVEEGSAIALAPDVYRSTVTYPADNPLAKGLKMVAQAMIAVPQISLFHVYLGGFDTHARQLDSTTDKVSGQHGTLLRFFSEGVKAFHDDLTEHELADSVVIMQWSEFGRRPQENGALGTDHGTAAPMIIIGNQVRGGVYGQQPSLASTDLDLAGCMKFTQDFRGVYSTIIDRWLGADSESILGSRFENLGFL